MGELFTSEVLEKTAAVGYKELLSIVLYPIHASVNLIQTAVLIQPSVLKILDLR